MACKASALSKAGFAFYVATPAAADAKAASVSATPATGACPKGRSLIGLNTGAVLPSKAAVQRPSMNNPNLSYILANLSGTDHTALGDGFQNLGRWSMDVEHR